jgi:Holliday junction DNA helicase RuvA
MALGCEISCKQKQSLVRLSVVIASLTGTVLSASAGAVVIDVQGVGFLLQTSSKTSLSLTVSAKATLFTSLVVREDALSLFGFLSQRELEVFDLLRSVNGVGPKSALGILSELSVDQIAEAVSLDSDGTFKAVSGIGVKTAKLITLTLSGKLGSIGSGSSSSGSIESAISALMGLGYSEKDSRSAVLSESIEGISDSALLKRSLKTLAKGKSR